MKPPWDIPAAISLYNIDRWGAGYFTINERGNISVLPTQEPRADRYHGADRGGEGARPHFSAGAALPGSAAAPRGEDQRAFAEAIAEANYRNVYRGVFPIKVNQLREVVEEIMDAGADFHFGLEAGSKPELLAALAIHRDPESLIICNGYKDTLFIQNALLGRKLGKKVIMVVEKIEELARDPRASRSEVGRRADDRRARAPRRAKAPASGRPAAARTRSSASAPRIWWRPARC